MRLHANIQVYAQILGNYKIIFFTYAKTVSVPEIEEMAGICVRISDFDTVCLKRCNPSQIKGLG